ncbi:hypothetical protein BS47DRAFT_818326 [Hydnum rufescens UP504]|uniref:Uncharacterized protein n=1 Tax=Hydnum rufescens UP504 TaxID=1448309 RepID=A0A9P6AZZ2_9AGAM|nr:hypothetical protein BS47DRAFT_818326 [Hydnum rufescens UP504]
MPTSPAIPYTPKTICSVPFLKTAHLPSASASAFIALPGTDLDTGIFERTSTARDKISPTVSSPSSFFSPSWKWPSPAKDLDDQGRSSSPPSRSTHNLNTSHRSTASSFDTVDTFESFINAARSIFHWPTPPSSNDDLKATMRTPQEAQLSHLQDPLLQLASSTSSHACGSILPPTPSSLTLRSSNSSRGSALILGSSLPAPAFPPTSLCFPSGPLIATSDPYLRGSPRIPQAHEQQPKHREVPLLGILPSPPLTDSPLSTVSVFQSTPHSGHPISGSYILRPAVHQRRSGTRWRRTPCANVHRASRLEHIL